MDLYTETTTVREAVSRISSDCMKILNPSNQTNVIHSINDNISFAFHGSGILLLTIFGISANVLSVIVLTHPKLKSSLTTLLLGLTISDIFVIGTSFLTFSLSVVLKRIQVFSYYSTHIRPHLLPWLLPIALTAQMSSVYFTIVITLERYIAVCLPLKARSLCTRSSAKRSALIVVLLSIFYNLPRWFEYKTVPKLVCANYTTYREADTDFRKNENYILYYVNWAYLVFLNLIPFTILVYFNIVIYSVTKRQRSRRNSLSPTRASKANEDAQLAGMLLGIVITFLVCNTLALVINVMESFGIGDFANLIPISNFLIICSSSSNFVFYFAFGTQFRRRLKRTLGISPKEEDPRKSSGVSTNIVSAAYLARMASSTLYRGGEGEQQSCSTNTDIDSSNDKNNNGDRNEARRNRRISHLPSRSISCESAQSELSVANEDEIRRSRLSGSQLTVQTII